MRAAEFLRKLADALAVIEDDGPPETSATPDVMVPPLQQKIEILKKSQGIDNVYDDGATHADDAVVVTTAEEDEPFEG